MINGELPRATKQLSDPFGVGPLYTVESISLSPHTLAQICKIRQILLEDGEKRSGYSILGPSFQDLGFVDAKPIVSIRQNTVGVGRVCTKNTIDVSVPPETEKFSMDTNSLKASEVQNLPHGISKLLFFNPRPEALSAIEEAGNPPNTAVCYQQSWSQADKSTQTLASELRVMVKVVLTQKQVPGS